VSHWDHQIYKALEISYQKGLESVNDNLPEMKVEIVFTNKTLEFKPPLEQIRQNYYKELKKFVNIPYVFEGFGDNSAIYKRMGVDNSKRLATVYLKAESLFTNLEAMIR
jgi:dynein heavy chain 2